MARRPRIHSRDLQPLLATPQGLLAVARVQRFDWPATYPTTDVDELARKLHVGQTQETPQVTVTVEAFDVTHTTFAYLTGYTGATFPVSGASVTELKNVDVIGHIRNADTQKIVNALYVKRGRVTAMDATFGVRANSTISYTISSNSKKELRQPVFYDKLTVAASGAQALSYTPTFLTRTSGYILDAYRTGADGTTGYLDEGTDFTVAGGNITWIGTTVTTGDTIWVTYSSAQSTTVFQAPDNASPAAIQGKYVPLAISAGNIPRVQSATIKVAFQTEEILEMGGLGKPVGYEIGIPQVTGDVSVLKTDNDLLAILEGYAAGSGEVENDLEFAKNTLPLKITLKDPRNPGTALLTYYVPSITITAQGDTNSVNGSMDETFSWSSTTGELFVMSGVGVF